MLARITIGIPTYNRAGLLKNCLATLAPILESLNGQIDLLVSDNFSTDETQAVLRDFEVNGHGSFRFRSLRQIENIGAVPNIFALIESCTTEYLIFLGDDDAVTVNGLQRLLSEMQESPASHFVEGTWPWRKVAGELRLSPEKSGSWGYEMGLAWSSVYNVKACQYALELPGLKAQLGKSIWGQIGLALSSIQFSNLEVRVMPFSWGFVHQDRPYRYGYDNLLLSFRDLIRSHRDASQAVGKRQLLEEFLTMRNHGYRSHLLGILVESSTLDKAGLPNDVWADILGDAKEISKISHLLTMLMIRTICFSRLRLLVVPLRHLARVAKQGQARMQSLKQPDGVEKSL